MYCIYYIYSGLDSIQATDVHIGAGGNFRVIDVRVRSIPVSPHTSVILNFNFGCHIILATRR